MRGLEVDWSGCRTESTYLMNGARPESRLLSAKIKQIAPIPGTEKTYTILTGAREGHVHVTGYKPVGQPFSWQQC